MNNINQGLMQDFSLTIPTLLEHAATNHASTEIVARLLDGSLFRYTYADLANRTRQAANALQKLGVEYGDVVGTLAWNNHWHMECHRCFLEIFFLSRTPLRAMGCITP